jgi:hypothetical protein
LQYHVYIWAMFYRALLSFHIAIILMSCGHAKEAALEKPDKESIVFVVMKIERSAETGNSLVSLVSRTESEGRIKKNYANAAHTANFLVIAGYNEKLKVDSIFLEHPLYRHLEYLDDKDMLAVRDTVLQQAEFFVRLQARGPLSKLRINEYIAGRPVKETDIKF